MSPPETGGQNKRGSRRDRPRTVQISIPRELIMDLLDQGGILQVQIGPVPDLARPVPRPYATNDSTRPEHSQTPGQILEGLRLA